MLQTAQHVVSTWPELLEWLSSPNRPEMREIRMLLLGWQRAVIDMGTSSHDVNDPLTSNGLTERLDGERIVSSFIEKTLSDDQRTHYASRKSLKLRIFHEDVGVLRCYLARCSGHDVLAVRFLDEEREMDFDLPEAIRTGLASNSKILLLAGTGGSGATTAFGAVMRRAIESHPDARTVTIGSPVVQHDFRIGHSVVLPINVGHGHDMHKFSDAIGFAMDINAAVVGIHDGLSDYASLRAAISAASKGCVIIATLRAPNAILALHQIYTLIPHDERERVWGEFCYNFLGVLALALVPSIAPGQSIQVPDIIVGGPRALNALLAFSNHDLRQLQEKKVGGSLRRDDALYNAWIDNRISQGALQRHALDQEAIAQRLRGGRPA
jgi:Tfp pilus assembly pilus retraction ATPase PilT